ncbi:hypothetical protein CEP54_016224 [Fusarium duplospermum]|uniref:Secreted protein n=1 Tax=Fusarium duplospermum TaxID=1325734 RepID=A0A428NGT3_9HYPO|nr:hypothetical protein CEP54_016224 [Fusarium duplospermum]
MGWRSPLSSTFLFFLPTRLILPAVSCRLPPVGPRIFQLQRLARRHPSSNPITAQIKLWGRRNLPAATPRPGLSMRFDSCLIGQPPLPPMLEIASPSRSCPYGGKLILERKGSSRRTPTK